MAQKTSETSNIGLQSSTLNHPTIIQAIFQKVPHFRGIGLKILGSRLWGRWGCLVKRSWLYISVKSQTSWIRPWILSSIMRQKPQNRIYLVRQQPNSTRIRVLISQMPINSHSSDRKWVLTILPEMEPTLTARAPNHARSHPLAPTRQHAQTPLPLLRVWNLRWFWHPNQRTLFLAHLRQLNHLHQSSLGKYQHPFIFPCLRDRRPWIKLHDGPQTLPSANQAHDYRRNYGTWQRRRWPMAIMQVSTVSHCRVPASLQR